MPPLLLPLAWVQRAPGRLGGPERLALDASISLSKGPKLWSRGGAKFRLMAPWLTSFATRRAGRSGWIEENCHWWIANLTQVQAVQKQTPALNNQQEDTLLLLVLGVLPPEWPMTEIAATFQVGQLRVGQPCAVIVCPKSSAPSFVLTGHGSIGSRTLQRLRPKTLPKNAEHQLSYSDLFVHGSKAPKWTS